MVENQFQWLRPKTILKITKWAIELFIPLSRYLFFLSIILGVYVLAEDYQQGEHFKMIFIHVPFAWACMFLYVLVAFSGALYLFNNHPLLQITTNSFSFVGTLFTLCCLVTGSLWGFPTWGTFWVWDARLTSVLILLFIYLIHQLLIFIQKDKIASVFSVIGLINLPIIKYSVEWWSTLHQGASVTQSVNNIHESILLPMLIIFFCLILYALIMLSLSLRKYINTARSHLL
mgnify:CR=1 FL=1